MSCEQRSGLWLLVHVLQADERICKLYSVTYGAHIDFLNAYLQVQQTYKPFIRDWLNKNEVFPISDETARYFTDFNHSKGLNFERMKCRMQSFGYKPILDSDGNSILCEEIKFTDLGSFMYYDFFRGIAQNYLPNRCKNCGKYFLIRGSWYYAYCDNPLADEPDKTFRNVGSKRSYDKKCKNNPIWRPITARTKRTTRGI